MSTPREGAPEPAPAPVLGLEVLRGTVGWAEAIDRLRQAWEEDREHAEQRSEEIRQNFRGRRGLMVLDVVLSRQRRYKARVSPMLDTWLDRVADANAHPTLAWVSENPGSYMDVGLREGESDTIVGVAQGLLRYGADHDLSDDDTASEGWARGAVGLELAPKLDPYVGTVKGIGPALLAYLRMLCGEDTVKPDVRVLRQLRAFGVDLKPADAAAGFVAAGAVAHELGIAVIDLDQLLWYRSDRAKKRP